MNNLNYQHLFWLKLIFIFCFIFLNPTNLAAHGVNWITSSKPSYGFEFNFDDGTPMAFAEIKVFKPGEPETLSQTGRTDKNGYFAFIPDTSGQWTIKADDGTGHLTQAQIDVVTNSNVNNNDTTKEQFSTHNLNQAINKANKPFKISLVISVFINLALVSIVWKRKKA